MKYNPDEAMESRQSEGLAVKTKAASAPAPAAPDWSERSETSILLEAVENQEYAVKRQMEAGHGRQVRNLPA